MDPVNSLPDVEDNEIEEAVVVPEIRCPLDQTQIQVFEQRMSGVNRSGPWDIEPYLYAVQTLHDVLGHAP